MEASGKVALVTGAARRVGRVIALELARAGLDVGVHCRRSLDEAREVADQIRAAGRRAAVIEADLADPQACADAVARCVRDLGRLDVLVNNASVFEKIPLPEADARAWERAIRINTVAPALLARAAAPIMRSAGAGRIVNLIDILADRPIKGHTPYCASKAALVALTRALAVELAPQITVNGVSPGIAVFPEHYEAPLRRTLTAQVPLKREGTPGEVAAVVRFLVTEADYITGQVIAVDGGMSL